MPPKDTPADENMPVDAPAAPASASRMIGQRVKRAREDRQWSQNQLAERAGVDSGYISRLEAGKYASPGHTKLSAIANALGRRLSDITDPPVPSDSSDEDLRRIIAERLGPDRAEIGTRLFEMMRGQSISDLEVALRVFGAVLPPVSHNREN